MHSASLRFSRSTLLFSALALSLTAFSLSGQSATPTAPSASNKAATAQAPSWEQKTFTQGTLYTLTIPANSTFKVLPALSPKLEGITSAYWTQARGGEQKTNPLFLINSGFFDPNNQQTISYIYQDGVLAADPKLNTQLTHNPNLTAYLPKIFNRPEFRVYLCRKKQGAFHTRYDIAPRDAAIPTDCLLQDSVGAGPSLLPTMKDFEEGFVDYNAQGKITRDPIGVCARNARSAVGLTSKGDVILMMGAQNPKAPKASGFSLPEIAALLKARGATKAMALDGGSSSGLVYQGKVIYGKFNADGSPVKRPVKSVLLVTP